ncbi:hypothetical protein ACK9YZ_30265 [Rhizobium sp. ZK1]|uniref:hypothetical protein n=1 Tax=Rhizobium sp. ZK1 TaxID=3389872 RepID=UPI0039F6548A
MIPIDLAKRCDAEQGHPLIITQRGAGSAEGFRMLSRLSDDEGIAICQYWAIQLAAPADHPMVAGYAFA